MAVVGAGLMGKWHADAARRIGVHVAAIVDSDLQRAATLARRYRHPAVHETLRAALDATRPHAVHICTPLPSHVTLASEAIAAGVHVLVEKPMTPSSATTKQLLDQARAQHVVACPVHQLLFQNGVRRALELVPTIGPLRHIDAVACSAGADGRSEQEERQLVAMSILPHPLSIWREILGTGFRDLSWDTVTTVPGELRAFAHTETLTVAAVVSMGGRPTRNSMRLIGERGTIHLDLFHGFAVVEPPPVSRTRKITRPFSLAASTLSHAARNLATRTWRRESAYPGLRDLIRRFYSAATEGTRSPISPEATLDVATAYDAIVARL